MSSIHRMRVFRTVAVAGAMILLATSASAGVESSCPDPCVRLPKSALFVRETNGTLDQNNNIVSLSGTLLKGTAKTVLRLDVSLMVHAGAGVGGVYFFPFLNGKHPSIGYGQEADGPEILVRSVEGGRLLGHRVILVRHRRPRSRPPWNVRGPAPDHRGDRRNPSVRRGRGIPRVVLRAGR